jgi:hypothetical protein
MLPLYMVTIFIFTHNGSTWLYTHIIRKQLDRLFLIWEICTLFNIGIMVLVIKPILFFFCFRHQKWGCAFLYKHKSLFANNYNYHLSQIIELKKNDFNCSTTFVNFMNLPLHYFCHCNIVNIPRYIPLALFLTMSHPHGFNI